MSDLYLGFGVIGAILVVVALFVRLVASMLNTVTTQLVDSIKERLAAVDDRLEDHAERLGKLEDRAAA